MSRGVGAVEFLQELVPAWLAVVVALLTQLGDIWFLGVLLTALYWTETPTRDDVAAVAGALLAGIGLYSGLKAVFALPRPDQPLLEPAGLPWLVRPVYEATGFATGYGFPSGHATTTTIVYFGLASVLTVSTRRRRFAGAAVVVAAVSLSRIVLGVHYLVDVVAGVAVGAAVLLLTWTLVDRSPIDGPTVAFALAIGFGGFFVRTSEGSQDALVALAAALGAFAGWQLVVLGRQLAPTDRPSRAPASVVLRGAAATLAIVASLVALALYPVATSYAVGGAIVLASIGVLTAPSLRQPRRTVATGRDCWTRVRRRVRTWRNR